ncbi:aggregation-promoting factor C-terminal-like domain-containing protein, partial [Micromonospora chersina]
AAKEAAERAKEAEAAAASRKKEREAAEKAAAKPYDGPIPASCEEFSGNRKIGCAIMLDEGFGIDQFPCLDKLWTKESGWNHKAYNEGSGAYGIPQALPGSKMGSVADDWKTNPATQIKWGLGYIEGRYDDPCGAWAHSQSTGWY